MAFSKPDRNEYDPNRDEPVELSPQQRDELLTGLVRFLQPSNKEWIKLHLKARSGDTVRGTPSQHALSRLPKREEGDGTYDPEAHD